MPRLPRRLLLGALLLAATPAFADEAELVPVDGDAPSLLRSSDTDTAGLYHSLAPGGSLDFVVAGPGKFHLYLRQRLPAAAPGAELPPQPTARVNVLGDGGPIPPLQGIEVAGAADPGAALLDVVPGLPGVVTVRTASLDMGGDHVLTIQHSEGTHPLIVRVTRIDAGAAPAAVADDDPLGALLAAAADEPTPEVPAEGPWPALAETATDTPEVPAEAVWPSPVPPPPLPPGPEEAPGPEEPTGLAGLSLGPRVGLGAAASGTRASGYLGMELRVPLRPQLDLTASLGRYGIRYAESFAVQPSIGGAAASTTADLAWSTRVRPLELGLRGARPIGGDVEGFAGVGLATYLVTRIPGEEEAERQRALALGTAWSLGMDIPIGPGVLSPSLSLNTGRRGFDNPAPNADEARERLRTGRFNTAYLVTF